jgi:hypothetical protein
MVQARRQAAGSRDRLDRNDRNARKISATVPGTEHRGARDDHATLVPAPSSRGKQCLEACGLYDADDALASSLGIILRMVLAARAESWDDANGFWRLHRQIPARKVGDAVDRQNARWLMD